VLFVTARFLETFPKKAAMYLKAVDTTKSNKTLAFAKLTKGKTPQAKANKLVQKLEDNQPTVALVLSNFAFNEPEGTSPLRTWVDISEALEVIKAHTFVRGADKKPRKYNPKSLGNLKPWSSEHPRPRKQVTAPWHLADEARSFYASGMSFKAVGTKLGIPSGQAKYIIEGGLSASIKGGMRGAAGPSTGTSEATKCPDIELIEDLPS
jgi:hypothetical protein